MITEPSRAAPSPAQTSGRDASGVRFEALWLALLLLSAVLIKIAALHHPSDPGIDGAYYLEIAKHVRDGEGLVTRVSLYHQGFEHFPHPSPIYPLWPWLVGMCARVLPLEQAGELLAASFYVLSLVGFFFYGRKLFPEPLFPSHLPGLHAGHVGAFFLAIVKEYETFTSKPYTEGLGVALCMFGGLRAASLLDRPSVRGALELALWSVLAFFARSQLFPFGLSVGMILVYGVLVRPGQRGAYARALAAFVASVLLLLLPHVLRVSAIMHRFDLSALIEFQKARPNHLLSEQVVLRTTHGVWEYLSDRAAGLWVAYGAGTSSFGQQFQGVQWFLPLGLGFMLLRAGSLLFAGRAWPALRQLATGSLGLWHAIVHAALSYLLLHHVHKSYFFEWNFQRRHAVLCVIAFWLGFVYLMRKAHPLGAAIAVFVLCCVVASGTGFLFNRYYKAQRLERPLQTYREAAAFLERRAKGQDLSVAFGISAQAIVFRTEHVNYHWIDVATTAQDLVTLVDKLAVRYVLVEQPIKFKDPLALQAFDRLFVREGPIRNGLRFYGLRAPP